MARSRIQTLLAVAVVGVGLLLVAIPGMWVYMKTTATVLHPNPETAPSVTAGAPSPKWDEGVEKGRDLARAALNLENLPGLSVAVGVGGEVVWAEGFGYADLDRQIPVTPSHRFRMGTASIVLTSAAAGLLLDEGKLKLDEPIQSYVPEFAGKPWPVTVRQVMAHTAGIRSDGGDEGPLLTRHCETTAEGVAEFAKSELLFQPGTRYMFSRYGWILVSAAVESAAGKPFLSYMKERVFDPLGMQATVADPAPEEAKGVTNRVTSYFPRFAADPKYGLHDMRDLDLSCYSGSSVFLSTPSDLVRFGMAIDGGKLLRRGTVAWLRTSHKLTTGEETGYGLGWDRKTVTLAGRQIQVAGHDGDLLGGMVTSLITVPGKGIAVAVMSNISYADTFSLAVKIADAFAQ